MEKEKKLLLTRFCFSVRWTNLRQVQSTNMPVTGLLCACGPYIRGLQGRASWLWVLWTSLPSAARSYCACEAYWSLYDYTMRKYRNNYAFIDAQNLYRSIADQGWVLDYLRFMGYLRDRFGVDRAFLFIGYVATNQNLYSTLQKQGYILVFKPTLVLSNGRIKGNVDAELVLTAMLEYPNYDKAVIVAGDGDYYCLADHLRSQNKLLKLIIPNQYRYSSLLRKFAHHIVFMNQLRNKVELKTP